MKKALLLMLLLGLLGLAGCSQEDQAEVGEAVDTLQQEARETAQEAGEAVDDAGLTSKVKTALLASARLSTGDLNVDTRDQVVTLRGTVPDEEQIALAGEIARNTVPQGVQVANEIQVASAAPEKKPEEDVGNR